MTGSMRADTTLLVLAVAATVACLAASWVTGVYPLLVSIPAVGLLMLCQRWIQRRK